MMAKPTTAPAAGPSFRVGDERLVKVSANAAKKVSTLLQRQNRPNGVLRVAVIGGGCSGLQYKMDLQDAPANRDILVESAGIRVVVDPKSALYVTGSELDYIDALQDGGFKVKNPTLPPVAPAAKASRRSNSPSVLECRVSTPLSTAN